jgi:hypothetical protein
MTRQSSQQEGGRTRTLEAEKRSPALFHYGWRVLDTVLFLQMGQAYRARFRSYSLDQNVSGWRAEQQGEWDRLSTSVSFDARDFTRGADTNSP